MGPHFFKEESENNGDAIIWEIGFLFSCVSTVQKRLVSESSTAPVSISRNQIGQVFYEANDQQSWWPCFEQLVVFSLSPA